MSETNACGPLDESPALFRKILAFPLDRAGDPYPFSRRLAKERGWETTFALRAIVEYRKFLCLTQASGDRSITPSTVVDEVWHLHLTYSRSYWEGLCRGVLGRPLHHDPTDGRIESAERHRADYRYTLELYRRHFGEPPIEFWPAAEVSRAGKLRRLAGRMGIGGRA